MQFTKDWEFVHESGFPSEVTKKLNQWRHLYEIIFVKVDLVVDQQETLSVFIARKKLET